MSRWSAAGGGRSARCLERWAMVWNTGTINIVINWRWTESAEATIGVWLWPVGLRVRLLISPLLIDMPNVNQTGSQGNNSSSLIGSLSCCIAGRRCQASECAYHSVHPITSRARFPPSPVFLNLFQFSLYLFRPCLIHSDFISYRFSPLSTFPAPLSLRVAKMGSSRASGRLLTQEQRGAVIELNGLNMSLWHFHKACWESQQSLTSRIPMLISVITESSCQTSIFNIFSNKRSANSIQHAYCIFRINTH